MYLASARCDDELEVLHVDAVGIAEHLINYPERLFKSVLIGNSAVDDAVLEFQADDVHEAIGQTVILYVAVLVGAHDVVVSVLTERICILDALFIGLLTVPVVLSREYTVAVLTVPLLHLVKLCKKHPGSLAAVVGLNIGICPLGVVTTLAQFSECHRLVATRELDGNVLCELLTKPLNQRTCDYVIVEELKHILRGSEHVALRVVRALGELQYEQSAVFINDVDDILFDLSGNFLDAVVTYT
ncbi:unknown [Eubacterium sp. CAG:786]|nr:unknown [Eubacterium sp. CAG:786]